MSSIDIALVIVFVAAIIYGLYKGLIAQLGSLGGIILGVIACHIWGDDAVRIVGEVLPEMTSGAQTAGYVNSVIGNVLLFLLVYMLTVLIAKLLRNITSALSLGWIDRLLGSVFGLVKWFLILSLILNLWEAVLPEYSLVKSSQLAGGVAIRTVLDLAPTLFGSVAAL